MKLPSFDYVAPRTLAEASAILAADDGAKLISGGQSLIPMLAFRIAYPTCLVDLRRIEGLGAITITPEGVRLGARVRWCDIEADRRLDAAHPLLKEMIANVAHYQVRNRGTVGGSLAHADPAAEMPGAAVVCDCEIAVAGASGARTIPAAELFTGPLQTTLEPSEIITEVRFPPWPGGRRWGFIELSRRKGDFALAGVAIHYDEDALGRAANVRVGVIGLADRPVRLPAVEAAIEGRLVDVSVVAAARAAAVDAVDPLGDIHAGADYRRSLAGTLTARVLARAARLEREAA